MEKRKYILMILPFIFIFLIGNATQSAANIIIENPEMQQKQGAKKIVPFRPKLVPFEQVWQKTFAKISTLNTYQQIGICSHILHFIDPNFTPAYLTRAAAYFSDGEYEQAVKDYSSAIAQKMNTSAVYCNRAIAYNYIGKYEKAIADLNKALSLDPKNAEAYYERGYAIYGLSRRLEKAAPDFKKAAELNKSYANADYLIAMKYRKDKVWLVSEKKGIDYSHYEMYQQALVHFRLLESQEIIEPKIFDPEYIKAIPLQYGAGHGGPAWEYRWFFVEMMKTYVKNGRFRDAISIAKSGIQADMDQEAKAELYAWRGCASAGVRKLELFNESRQKALDLAPNSPTVYWILGDAYHILNNQKQAILHYQKALSYLTPADQRYVKISCALASVYKKAGNLTNAKVIYQDIIATQREIPGIFKPTTTTAKLYNAPLYLCFGEAYDNLGDSEKAKQYYHTAIAVNRELKDQIPEVYHPTYAEEIPFLPVVGLNLDKETAIVPLPGRSSIEPIYDMPFEMY